MKSKHGSIMTKLLALVMGVFFALALSGCGDPIIADMEAEHYRLGSACQRDLRMGLSGFPTTAQAPTFRPAP